LAGGIGERAMRLSQRCGEQAGRVAPVALEAIGIKTDVGGDDEQVDEPIDEVTGFAVADRVQAPGPRADSPSLGRIGRARRPSRAQLPSPLAIFNRPYA